jgi:hypothetical protein
MARAAAGLVPVANDPEQACTTLVAPRWPAICKPIRVAQVPEPCAKVPPALLSRKEAKSTQSKQSRSLVELRRCVIEVFELQPL